MTTVTTETTILPGPLSIPDSDIDDLRARLARTRWPDQETVGDWSQGVPLQNMRALIEHWRDRYDWRVFERKLNGMNPSTTVIDGTTIHFLHVPSPEPDAMPIVLTHGWPGSVIEFMKVAPMLADPRSYGGDPKDAFHVVIPAMTGFGLSEKPRELGRDYKWMAKAWVELMHRLGYDNFVAQGGDWGYAVTNALGAIGAPAVHGVHFNMFPVFGTEDVQTEQEARAHQRLRDFHLNEVGYQIEQITSPQTIGYSLTDSPVGLAAWHYEKYHQWMDHDGVPENILTQDEMLDNISLYWFTNSSTSSARIYWESMREFKEQPIEVPVGYSQFPRDIHLTSQRWVKQRYPSLVHYNELPKGGHFPSWEQPEVFTSEVRSAFRSLR